MSSQEKIQTALDGLDWSEIAPSFIRYGVQAYKNAPLIHRLWRQLQLYSEKSAPLMEPKTNIAILGPDNVGKSVLNDALQARVREHSYNLPDASSDAERDLITIGRWSNVVSVVPGQGVQQKDIWLRKVFGSDGKLNGVIFVASWGYRLPRNEALAKQYQEEGISLTELRTRMLISEAREFRDVCIKLRELYQENKRSVWIIVAVAKADLFFSDLGLAEEFYALNSDRTNAGNFATVESFRSIYRKEIAERIGSDHVPAVSLPVSSFTENFAWGTEEVKTSIVDQDRSALLNHMIATMNALSPK